MVFNSCEEKSIWLSKLKTDHSYEEKAPRLFFNRIKPEESPEKYNSTSGLNSEVNQGVQIA